jgi:hypothetical protein
VVRIGGLAASAENDSILNLCSRKKGPNMRNNRTQSRLTWREYLAIAVGIALIVGIHRLLG